MYDGLLGQNRSKKVQIRIIAGSDGVNNLKIAEKIKRLKLFRTHGIGHTPAKTDIPEKLRTFTSGISRKLAEKLPEKLPAFLSEYRLLLYFITLICYLEFVYRIWTYRNISGDFIFPVLFSMPAGAVLFLIACVIPEKASLPFTAVSTAALSLCYGVQLIYYSIFRTPLSLTSIEGAGDASQFIDIVVEAVLKNFTAVVLIFIPVFIPCVYKKSIAVVIKKQMALSLVLLFCVSSYLASIICVNLTGDGPVSQSTLYYKAYSPEMSTGKLGLLTTMRLDFQRLAAGTLRSIADSGTEKRESGSGGRYTGNSADEGMPAEKGAGSVAAADKAKDGAGVEAGSVGKQGTAAGKKGGSAGKQDDAAGKQDGGANGDAGGGSRTGAAAGAGARTGEGAATGAGASAGAGAVSEAVPEEALKPFNTMDIDFEALMAGGKEDPYYPLHKYFSSVSPTATNQYTGMFKGDNLIMLTAESFSPYVISPELTPTLYRMATEGFVFNNFYNPVWWVSTSDGEYVACTGLIPKSGVWSLAASGKNYMPFTMGNQFRKLGYMTKAYHDHTYTYYKRHISHPNMGYDYKGVGNGLNVKKTWPESDLEMIDVTVGEYIGRQPFHTYYMTVSGHMNYNFSGNQMAAKNKKYVEDLPYSDEAKAYIACNLELEFAMRSLIEKLEAAGIAENTVIAISADHYPYGLARESIDELAGHKVEENFELYKSTFILWKKGMKPVIVDKPCTSLDILPTLSNLFGLEYDSRLLMGTDILSDSPALALFSNRSWITDRAVYNTVTDKVRFTDGTSGDSEYIKKINRIVANKFKYSAEILDKDYYRKILPQ